MGDMISSRYRKRGFTLLELVVVIMLVAALATLFFPMFGYLREKARDAACIGNCASCSSGRRLTCWTMTHIWPQMPEEPWHRRVGRNHVEVVV